MGIPLIVISYRNEVWHQNCKLCYIKIIFPHYSNIFMNEEDREFIVWMKQDIVYAMHNERILQTGDWNRNLYLQLMTGCTITG